MTDTPTQTTLIGDEESKASAEVPEVIKIPPGFMQNKHGGFDPISKIKDWKLRQHETVESIVKHAVDLSATIARFKMHTINDIDKLIDLLAKEYDIHPSGLKQQGKGNVSFQTYDSLMKVEISVQDRLTFGPELVAAKAKFDEFIKQEAKFASKNVKMLLSQAFQLDKKGRINRGKLFSLKNFKVDDPLWNEAIRALNDAIQVESSKSYIRIYTRPTTEDKWIGITLDIANL